MEYSIFYGVLHKFVHSFSLHVKLFLNWILLNRTIYFIFSCLILHQLQIVLSFSKSVLKQLNLSNFTILLPSFKHFTFVKLLLLISLLLLVIIVSNCLGSLLYTFHSFGALIFTIEFILFPFLVLIIKKIMNLFLSLFL